MTRSRSCRRLVLALILPLGLVAIPALAAPAKNVRVAAVTDGDTFRLTTGERVRIAEIDAPESDPRRARCTRELVRGKAAGAQARALLAGREVSLARVGLSYGRTVARVRLDGRDVAALLVARGAAAWWPRYQPKPDWCARSGARP